MFFKHPIVIPHLWRFVIVQVTLNAFSLKNIFSAQQIEPNPFTKFQTSKIAKIACIACAGWFLRKNFAVITAIRFSAGRGSKPFGFPSPPPVRCPTRIVRFANCGPASRSAGRTLSRFTGEGTAAISRNWRYRRLPPWPSRSPPRLSRWSSRSPPR